MSTSFPLDGLRVRFAGDTNVGMKREHNEDSFFLPKSERLAIVADGMGGHASGEVASRLAVDTIVNFFQDTAEERPPTWPFKVDHGQKHEINRLVTAV
jgi:PPM family protein phosphatase